VNARTLRPQAPNFGASNAVPPSPLITPAPTPQEAAAIVAAIECFERDTAASARSPQQAAGGWLHAARAEAVGRAPGRPAASDDWDPLARPRPHASN
jgi:hypothetical protein